MFRRWKERKAAKNKKGGGGVELIGVEPRGSHFVDAGQPEYLGGNMKKKSRSMELLSETSRPPLPPDAKIGKRERLRVAKSFSEEGDSRERRRRSQDMPIFYTTGNSTSGQTSAIPNLRQGQGYGRQYSSGTPPQHHQPVSTHPRGKYANGSPPTSQPSAARTPSPGGRHARYRNIQIIPQMEPKRPASFPSTPTNDLRTPSPVNTPGQSPRHKPKGTPIKIVEGWDEPEDTGSNVVQSHEVGVAPRSKIMEAFKRNQNHSSPFAITITNDDSALGSASLSPVKMREGSEKKRNKARPISAMPFAMITGEEEFRQKKQSLDRRSGHLTITFNE